MNRYDTNTTIRTNTRGQTAEEILEERLSSGTGRAMDIIEYVQENVPQDAIVLGNKLRFDADEVDNDDGPKTPQLMVSAKDHTWTLHRNAMRQMCGVTNLPLKYSDELTQPGAQGQRRMELLAHNLNELFNMVGGRYLTRSLGSDMRGFLSDKYRRLDSGKIVEAFAESCHKLGARPYEGTRSDTRYNLTAIIPRVYTPVPNEAIAVGIQLKNSDFGTGAFNLSLFVERLWCLNGCVMKDALRQVHVGQKLEDDISWSDRTMRLDSARSVSMMRDGMKDMLGNRGVEKLLSSIEAMHHKEVNWQNAKAALRKKLYKSEFESVVEAFESDDIVNLPAGQTQARLSNALSWVANSTASSDRKMDLQRYAGEVVDKFAA